MNIKTYTKGGNGNYRLRVCPKSFNRLKQKIKEITRKTYPIPFCAKIGKVESLTKAWVNYFKDVHSNTLNNIS